MRRFILAVVSAGLIAAPAGLAIAGASTAAAAPAAPQAVAVNWPVVKQGAKGELVRVIQLLLNARGAAVVVDGDFGKTTTTAVKAFQTKNKLAVDGFVGPASWPKLVATVKKGSRGDAVRALQHQLRFQYGYKPVVDDGVFGTATETAVKGFQKKHKLVADGIAGTTTWKALEA